MYRCQAGVWLSEALREDKPFAFVVVYPASSRVSSVFSSPSVCRDSSRDGALRAVRVLRERPLARGRTSMLASTNSSFLRRRCFLRPSQEAARSDVRMCSEGSEPARLDSREGGDTDASFAAGLDVGNVVSDTGEVQCEVELRNVTLRYGEKVILNDVSLTINRGESLALLGPSGTWLQPLFSDCGQRTFYSSVRETGMLTFSVAFAFDDMWPFSRMRRNWEIDHIETHQRLVHAHVRRNYYSRQNSHSHD